MWDTALKFFIPVLRITSPDHLEYSCFTFPPTWYCSFLRNQTLNSSQLGLSVANGNIAMKKEQLPIEFLYSCFSKIKPCLNNYLAQLRIKNFFDDSFDYIITFDLLHCLHQLQRKYKQMHTFFRVHSLVNFLN